MKHSFDITGFQLKIAAIVAMTCNHVANVFGPQLPEYLDFIFYAVGGVTFPIMAFLLVEGYAHTSNLRSYALRLMVFAILSQVPYYLVFRWPLNVLFTLLIGLGILWLNDRYNPAMGLVATVVGTILLQGVVDWGTVGFVIIYCFGTLREAKRPSACALNVSRETENPKSLLEQGSQNTTERHVPGPHEQQESYEGLQEQQERETPAYGYDPRHTHNHEHDRPKSEPREQRRRDILIIVGTMMIPLIVTCLSALRYLNVHAFGYAVIGYTIATILLCGYRGRRGRPMKWFFYAYYPLHLFVIWLITVILS